ncbi:MAG: hypothetical protein ACOYEV_13380 [Candidatus Nanopelagicales bacterium]
MFDTARSQLARAGDTVMAGSEHAYQTAREALNMLGHLGRSAPGTLGGGVRDHSAELITTTVRTREILAALIQSELDRAVGTLGLVPESELIAVRQSVERLERQMVELSAKVAAGTGITEAA